MQVRNRGAQVADALNMLGVAASGRIQIHDYVSGTIRHRSPPYGTP